MANISPRKVTLERESEGVYIATNEVGSTLRFGSDAEGGFSPVELLLAAIAGCSAIDVDVMTSRRAEPERFDVTCEADYVKDPDTGNILQNIRVTFDLAFPEGEDGDKAKARVASALRSAHDRTCTVSRTVEAGVPVVLREA